MTRKFASPLTSPMELWSPPGSAETVALAALTLLLMIFVLVLQSDPREVDPSRWPRRSEVVESAPTTLDVPARGCVLGPLR